MTRQSRARITLLNYMFNTIMLVIMIATLGFLASFTSNALAISVDDLVKLGRPVAIHLETGLPRAIYIDEANSKIILVSMLPNKNVYVLSVLKYDLLERQYILYPVNGEVTSSHVDRIEAPQIITVATDLGEILAVQFTEEGNYKIYVQGSEYSVSKVRVAVDGTIAAMFSDGTLRVYRIKEGGWYEKSAIISTSVKSGTEGVVIHDFEMLLQATGSERYTVPAMAVLEELISKQATITLTILSRLITGNETVLVPLNDTKVIFYLEDLKQYVVGSTDANGVVSVQVPIPVNNVTMFIEYEGLCYATRLVNIGLFDPDQEYRHENPIILQDMEQAVCPRPYRPLLLTLYTITMGLPEVKARIPLQLLSTTSFIHLFVYAEERDEYMVFLEGVYNETKNQYGLLILHLDKSFNIKHKQWMKLPQPRQGVQPPIVTSIAVSPDANIVTIGTKTGRIYVLIYDPLQERYVLYWNYVVDENKEVYVSLGKSVRDKEGIYPLAAISSSGIFQVFVLNTTINIPILRIGYVLHFNTGYGGGVAISRDMEVAIASSQQGIYLVLGLWAAPLRSPTIDPINLTNYIVSPLVIHVAEPDGTPVSNAKVEVYTINGTLVDTVVTGVNGTAQVNYLLPGTYKVKVIPQHHYWLANKTTTVVVKPGGSRTNIILNYKPVKATIRIIDDYTGNAPEEPLNITIVGSNITITRVVKENIDKVEVSLIKGVYNITVKPLAMPALYEQAKTILEIPGKEGVELRLKRIVRTLVLNILDERGNPLTEPVEVNIVDNEGRNLFTASVTREQLPLEIKLGTKGTVTINIVPIHKIDEEPKYKEITYRVNLTGSTTLVSIRIPYNYIPVTLLFIDEYTGSAPIVPIRVLEAGRTLAVIPPGTSEKTFYFTKGVHQLTIVSLPTKDKPSLYYNVTLTLDVKASMAYPIVLKRAFAEVALSFMDALTRTLPIDELEIYVNGTRVAKVEPSTKETRIYVPKGHVLLAVQSANKIYYSYEEEINLVNDTLDLLIGLRRSINTIRVIVVNDLGQKLTGASIVVVGIDVPFETTSTTIDGESLIQLPYGSYQVCVEASWYYPSCEVLSTATQTELTIMLKPQPIGILMRNLPLIIVVSVIGIVVAVIYMKRSAILRALALEEEEVI